jgi:hypothetical protein
MSGWNETWFSTFLPFSLVVSSAITLLLLLLGSSTFLGRFALPKLNIDLPDGL